MQYPYITLKIENHIPHIYFHKNETTSKRLTQKDESLMELINALGKRLKIEEKSLEDASLLELLLQTASESDDTVITDLPEINTESLEFGLQETINTMFEQAKDKESIYTEVEAEGKIKEELEKLHRSDLLASIIEQIYKILIAKTLLAAYELEINTIQLDQDYNYARLVEKMGRELQELNVEFETISVE